MRNKLCIVIIFLLFIGCFTFSSCKKEATCDFVADSTKIAKVFQPDATLGKDAVIEKIDSLKNTGAATYFTVFSWTNDGKFNTARSLLEFDLSGIPLQTKIKKATLSLYWYSYGNLVQHTGENAFSIYRITKEWDENAVTWKNQPAISTFHMITVSKSQASNQSYLDIDVTQLVQDMIDAPATSHGFMFKLNEEFPYRLVILGSSDCPDSSKRPKLIVYY